MVGLGAGPVCTASTAVLAEGAASVRVLYYLRTIYKNASLNSGNPSNSPRKSIRAESAHRTAREGMETVSTMDEVAFEQSSHTVLARATRAQP